MKMQLRAYQANALAFALDHLAMGKRAVIQLPTGTGKSLVLLSIAARSISPECARVSRRSDA